MAAAGVDPRGAAAARARVASRAALVLALPLVLACATARAPRPSAPASERGIASWYGPGFHGRTTASGETYDMHAMTAAHRTLPFDTLVAVENLDNGRQAEVRINDRGPFHDDRILDLSREAARRLGVLGPGTARVALRILSGPPVSSDRRFAVQVGAFRDGERAAALTASLARRYPAVATRRAGEWHRVQVGEVTTRAEAEALRRELAAAGLPAMVVAVP